ncbi:MAG: type II toxin-antitoxin system prevent-host-death family antitoxin [Gemmatimonadaceae bacterium]
MKTVGVKQLKARLSEYLRAVKRGDVVVVTERDTPIAELRAPRGHRDNAGDLRALLDGLAADGEITRASRKKKGWRWTAKGLGLPSGTATSVLDELRRDPFDR